MKKPSDKSDSKGAGSKKRAHFFKNPNPEFFADITSYEQLHELTSGVIGQKEGASLPEMRSLMLIHLLRWKELNETLVEVRLGLSMTLAGEKMKNEGQTRMRAAMGMEDDPEMISLGSLPDMPGQHTDGTDNN